MQLLCINRRYGNQEGDYDIGYNLEISRLSYDTDYGISAKEQSPNGEMWRDPHPPEIIVQQQY